jgi:hypothetical protein
MMTKARARFLNRAAQFEADIELVDIFHIASARGIMHTPGGTALFADVHAQKHRRLATRPNSVHARTLAIAHLRATIASAFMKDLYEDAIAYFSEILEAATRNGLDANRLVGEHQTTFKANDLLSAGSWHNVVGMVSQSIFRSLENEKNTRKLLEKLSAKLDLSVDEAKIKAALPYFEMRHLLVHADGVVDQAFVTAFPGFSEVVDRKLALENARLHRARKAVTELIEEFDQKITAKGLVAKSDCQPTLGPAT